MLRARPALVILCFLSFLHLKTQAAPRSCSRDIVRRVQTLLGRAPEVNFLDVSLYTPTTEDYEKCPRSTLKCFADEIKVLLEEWKTVVASIEHFRLNAPLEKLAKSLNQGGAACRQCELCKKQNATVFLSDLMSALQRMNQQFCEQSRSSENKEKS